MKHHEYVAMEILAEYEKAAKAFPAFNSAHEGYAVIAEELDELWDEVKNNKNPESRDRQRKEAIQVAAMALRFIVDVSEKRNG